MQYATFGMGCFWKPQELFDTHKGVIQTQVGYTGGVTVNPTYEDVCSGKTQHIECVRVWFDETQISYEELLHIFWSNHDYTQRNRQGVDIGSQYASAVFFVNEQQKKIIEETKPANAVTYVREDSAWYPAEEYHQQFLAKNKHRSC